MATYAPYTIDTSTLPICPTVNTPWWNDLMTYVSANFTLTDTPSIALKGTFALPTGTTVNVIEASGSGPTIDDNTLWTSAQIDAHISLEDLDFAGDSGTGSVDLDSQSLTIAGTANEITTVAGSQTLTISLPDDVTIGSDLTVTDSLVVNTNTLVVNASGYADRAGFGTATPDSNVEIEDIGGDTTRIHVDGQTSLASVPLVGLHIDSGKHGANSQLIMDAENDSGVNKRLIFDLDPDAQTTALNFLGNDSFVMDSGGNININGTDDATRLLINGNTSVNSVPLVGIHIDNGLHGGDTHIKMTAENASPGTDFTTILILDPDAETFAINHEGTDAIVIDSSQNTTLAGNLRIPNNGYIGSTSATTAIQIETDGDIVLSSDLTARELRCLNGVTGITNNTPFYLDSISDSYLIHDVSNEIAIFLNGGEEVRFTATQTTFNNSLVTTGSVDIGSTVAVVGTLDDDTFGTATNTTIATSESIKAYVDAAVLAEDYWDRTGTIISTQTADDDLTIGNGHFIVDTTTLVVNASGYTDKVGIGTATPSTTLHVSSSSTVVTFEDTNTFPTLIFYNSVVTPPADTATGEIAFNAKDDGGAATTYGSILGYVTNDAAANEDGYMKFNVIGEGALNTVLTLNANLSATFAGEATFAGTITANDGLTLGAGSNLLGSSTSDIICNTTDLVWDASEARLGIGAAPTAGFITNFDATPLLQLTSSLNPAIVFNDTGGSVDKGVIINRDAWFAIGFTDASLANYNDVFQMQRVDSTHYNFIHGDTSYAYDNRMYFQASGNTGRFDWINASDYFLYYDDILMSVAEKIQFRDTALYIHSSADTFIDYVADGGHRFSGDFTVDTDGFFVDAGTSNSGFGTVTPNAESYSGRVVDIRDTTPILLLSGTQTDGDGVIVGRIIGNYATNSATYNDIAYINFVTDGDTGNQRGGSMEFYTAPDATATPVLALSIDNAQAIIAHGSDLKLDNDVPGEDAVFTVSALTAGSVDKQFKITLDPDAQTATLDFGVNGITVWDGSAETITFGGNVLMGTKTIGYDASGGLSFDSSNNGTFSADLLSIGKFTTSAGRIKNTTRITAATYTILVTDDVVFCDTDSNAITATLPAGVEGQTFKIINSGSSGNVLTIAPNGAENLMGSNTSCLRIDGSTLILTYNATDGWY